MSRCVRSLIGQLSLLLVPNMVLSKMNDHEHRTKQTYESYTFQPLMSFWIYVKHEFTLFRWELVLVINTSLLKFSFNNQTTSSPIFFVGYSGAS